MTDANPLAGTENCSFTPPIDRVVVFAELPELNMMATMLPSGFLKASMSRLLPLLTATPAYYVFRRFSAFIDPGAKRVATTGDVHTFLALFSAQSRRRQKSEEARGASSDASICIRPYRPGERT